MQHELGNFISKFSCQLNANLAEDKCVDDISNQFSENCWFSVDVSQLQLKIFALKENERGN